MKLKIDAYGITDVGQQRSRNEDCFAIDPEARLYLVADGMGGHGNGHVASRIVIEKVGTFIRDADQLAAGEEGVQQAAEQLGGAVGSAQDGLRQAMEENRELSGMGTTLVGIRVLDEVGVVGHVGDSRAYRWRDGVLERLTRDHSWVDEQVAAGYLSEDQARSHPLKSVVTRALSGEGDVEVDYRVLHLTPGDRYLICSDGLTTMLTDADIRERLERSESLAETCRELVEECNERGGLDNITIVLLSVDEDDGTPDPLEALRKARASAGAS